MAYSYAAVEETPNVKALKLLLGDASVKVGGTGKDRHEYARMMNEVIGLVGQLAQALDANERMCERAVPDGMGQPAIAVSVH